MKPTTMERKQPPREYPERACPRLPAMAAIRRRTSS
jgi:hypothetical protein